MPVQKNWKPKFGDVFWFVEIDGQARPYCWNGCIGDRSLYKLGNCYRTQEEAERDSQKWMDFYASDEMLEV